MTDDRTPCITLPLSEVELLLDLAGAAITDDEKHDRMAAIQAEVDQVKGLSDS